ncbi:MULTISPECIES: DinB family protein [Variovorax]|uniref:DinB family protein n=1 Tax=Variovorax TaxID=34072 RepID=UPI0024807F51|nr:MULTISPECIES: DinB family protein [Variovorax]MDR6890783.1 putative damage-inducible protein DinB [Variovorax sp. 3319]WGT62437.1 DinB family protein [Variovorax paradoxus]
MNDTLHRLFTYKAWANDELLAALSGLGDNSPVTALAVKALSHTYVVDRIFAAHLRRATHAYPSANLSEMPRLEALAADLKQSDKEYIDYVSTLDLPELAETIDFAFTDGAPGRMSREEMLMHVVTHGTGHRGQVSAVMLLNSIPSARDGFATYLHEAEAATRRRSTR